MTGSPTHGEVLRRMRRALTDAGLADAETDARILLTHAGGLSPAGLIARDREPVPADILATADALLARRLGREPIQRILGEWEFHGLPFALNEATLIPRAETELIVEEALRLARAAFGRDGDGLVLADIGCGSGAIVVALLCELPAARGIAIDLIPRALVATRANAERNGVGGRIETRAGSYLDPLREKLPLIVANPPYIRRGEIAMLAPEVARHDPLLALDGGDDGLDAYRAIFSALDRVLSPGGTLIVEIGHDQAAEVGAIATAAGYTAVGRRDLNGRDRAIIARKADHE